MRSNIMNVLIDGSRDKAEKNPRYQAWLVECKAFEEKIEKQYPELVDELFDVVWGGSSAVGEAMFLEGWRLRGNVDELFDLPDDR